MKYIHLLSTLLITSLAQIFWRQKRDFSNVRSVVAKEGDTITFNFDVEEATRTVKWFYGEDPPQALSSEDKRKFNLHKDGSLTIKNLDVADSGQYMAEIEIMGNVADLIFKLNVREFNVDEDGTPLNKDFRHKTYYKTDPLLDNLGFSIKYNADFSKCYMLNTNLAGNDLKKYTYFDSTISICQLHCFETPGCTAFVYIKRNMETGASNECVLKSGKDHVLTEMVGFTSVIKNCLIIEDGRCYKRGYSLHHTNGNFLFRESVRSHTECQDRCLYNKECRTFSYNTIDRMCTFDKYVDVTPVFNNSDLVVSDKGCIRNTDRSCFNEGYGSPGEDIATIPKVYSIGQCILKCLENEECQIFVFLNLGDTMKDHCLLKKRPTLISSKLRKLNGAVSGDIECLKSRGEQCYYLKRKSNDESLIYLKGTAKNQYGCEKQCMVDDACEAFTYKPKGRECSRLRKIPRRLTTDALYTTGLKECLIQAAGGMKVQAVCEMDEKTLTCPKQQYLHILFAHWGRTDDWVCNEGSNSKSHCYGTSVAALMTIHDECSGKNSCRLRADPAVLGNFCSGITKYLKVVYRCSPVKVIPNINCENEVKVLKCENGERLRITDAEFGRRTNKVCFTGDYCSTDRQDRYRGHVRNTKSGKICQSWAAQEPHKHDYFTPEKFPNAGLDENFCRNPDVKKDKAWCFTLDPKTLLEECEIADCSKVPCKTDELVTIKRVRQLCHGRESCTVAASVQTLGDPCPYIPKYLTIEYYCSKGRGSAIYDHTMPILDQPLIDIAVRHLDQIEDLPHSECYVLNIDYPRGNIRVIRDVPSIERCRDPCLDNTRCNVFTYHVPSQRCTLKELPSLDVVDDIAGMISARKDCLELGEQRKKRSITVHKI